MKDIFFVDTNAWYARITEDDRFHRAAVEFAASVDCLFLTTNYVIMETANLTQLRQGYALAKKFLEIVHASQILTIHFVTQEDHFAALLLFLQNQTKASFTDCASFVIMRKLKIKNAFTFDQDFTRAGFSCFPKIRAP